MSIGGILQQETRDFLEGAAFATSYGQTLQWETSDFFNVQFLQRVTSEYGNE